MADKKKYNIKAVLFDLDDTLCNTDETKAEVFKLVYESNNVVHKARKTEFTNFMIDERESYLKKLQGLQTFTRLELWNSMMKKFSIRLSTRELKKIIDDYWLYSIEKLQLYSDVEKVLQKVFEGNVITAVLAGSDFYSKSSKLISLGIDEYFNYVFTADLISSPKTSPSMYRYVVKFLKLKPSEVLMIGNDPDQDIKPANEIGIKTAQVMFSGKLDILNAKYGRPNFVLREFIGILEILGLN